VRPWSPCALKWSVQNIGEYKCTYVRLTSGLEVEDVQFRPRAELASSYAVLNREDEKELRRVHGRYAGRLAALSGYPAICHSEGASPPIGQRQ